MVQGKEAGLDVKVQGEGAGLDKKVQTKPIIIPKTKYKNATTVNIHAKPKEQEDNHAKLKEQEHNKIKDTTNVNIHAKPKEQEDNKVIAGCKRPIVESRRVARDRNKVQEPRDTRNEPIAITKAEDKDILQVNTKEEEDIGERHNEVGKLGGDYYLPADPKTTAHQCLAQVQTVPHPEPP